MSAEALADLVERLVAQRERERREGAAHDDGALFEEMVTGLKAEMARLGKEVRCAALRCAALCMRACCPGLAPLLLALGLWVGQPPGMAARAWQPR